MSEDQIVEAHPGTPGNSSGHNPVPENKGKERKTAEGIKRPPHTLSYSNDRNHRSLSFVILNSTILIITGKIICI